GHRLFRTRASIVMATFPARVSRFLRQLFNCRILHSKLSSHSGRHSALRFMAFVILGGFVPVRRPTECFVPSGVGCVRHHPSIVIRRSVRPPDRTTLAKGNLCVVHPPASGGFCAHVACTLGVGKRSPMIHQFAGETLTIFF